MKGDLNEIARIEIKIYDIGSKTAPFFGCHLSCEFEGERLEQVKGQGRFKVRVPIPSQEIKTSSRPTEKGRKCSISTSGCEDVRKRCSATDLGRAICEIDSIKRCF
jgi:hypothetical protein